MPNTAASATMPALLGHLNTAPKKKQPMQPATSTTTNAGATMVPQLRDLRTGLGDDISRPSFSFSILYVLRLSLEGVVSFKGQSERDEKQTMVGEASFFFSAKGSLRVLREA
jgi:hypothetical protein